MQKVLIVKTTSLGDLIHTMPAVNDFSLNRPDIECHWLVEEAFHQVPLWHPFIKKVHTCAVRRWRKHFFHPSTNVEIRALKQALLAENYDLVIDAQGLFKSAMMVRWLTCDKAGYDRHSIREPIASFFYNRKFSISRKLTAIDRNRTLFAKALGYSVPQSLAFGLCVPKPDTLNAQVQKPFGLFLHGTNWSSKIWPQSHWQQLAVLLHEEGYHAYLPFGDDQEKAVACAIAQQSPAEVLPKLSLAELAYLIQQATFVIGSDTGLSHIAAALDTVTIGLYGSTNPMLTGLVGRQVKNLQTRVDCAPCMQKDCPKVNAGDPPPCYDSLPPVVVFNALKSELMTKP
ncbi:MAG: lipopolysaccharide heptosyltransferase I [Cellvibrionales bacterium]|nr:lipopolysaccharide heptosyltransferase I [Cellvibrionales bacterium]